MVDASDFAALYRRHGPTVFRRARQILGSTTDANEVVQELFLSLFERPEQYRGQSSIVTFLYAATTHACLNRVRNQRNRARLLRENLDTSTPVDARLSPEMLALLHQAVRQLPDDTSQAAVYHLIDGLSHQEIATILGCSRRHVGDLLARLEVFGKEESSPCQTTQLEKVASPT